MTVFIPNRIEQYQLSSFDGDCKTPVLISGVRRHVSVESVFV